eukprot:MONOS_1304.1-p1 / transcript=MONOS_1304.1 / gene=MONOS_1304 / organism=Monocercomonoides_exilis_PA203 / gene_product=unspecified product / transcript_product=unspecified product / location=Mono_scaffold00022:117434-120171(+) / protein_length=850 / sequence_SO=supercontig / SO=protein_coding / is_pseudo=false
MADEKGIATMTGHHLLDGIDSILIRCRSNDGLLDAIAALRITHCIGSKISQGIFQNWRKECQKHCFETILVEIALGNRNRGIAREKIYAHFHSYQIPVNFLYKTEGFEGLYDEFSLTVAEEQHIRREIFEDSDDREVNEEEDDKNEKFETKQKKRKEKITNDGAEAKPKQKSKAKVKSKAISELKTGKSTNETSDKIKRKQGTETIAKNTSTSMPSSLASPSVSASTATYVHNDASDKIAISFNIFIQSILAILDSGAYYGMFLPMKRLINTLIIGLRLPEDAETEYLKRKKETFQEEVVGDKANNEGSYCIMENAIRLMKGKIDILQIRQCLFCLDSLITHNLYNCKNFKISDINLKDLIDMLMRLNNFPDGLLFNLSSHCIEAICVMYQSEMKQLFLSAYERQMMEDLKVVEEEMKQIEEADHKAKGKENKKDDLMKISSRIAHQKSSNLSSSNWTHIPFNYSRMPSITEYDSTSEYEFQCRERTGEHLVEKRKCLQEISDEFRPQNIIFGCGLGADDTFITIPMFHYSLAALHFNHSLNCIAAMNNIKNDNCDEIVLKPYFEKLINRMAHPFPLIAPISVGTLYRDAYQQQSLESVQSSIDLFVLKTMTKTVKELQFVFKMGFADILFKWLPDGKDSNKVALFVAIQMIRENCIAFMDISRRNRIKEAVPYNENVMEVNNFFGNYETELVLDPEFAKVSVVSKAEIKMCYECFQSNDWIDLTAHNFQQLKLADFTEDAEELSKGDDIGAYLLRLIDDAVEENGIRDLVEATVQHNAIQLFWMCSGSLPSADRLESVDIFKEYDFDQITLLPLVEFEMPPVNLYDKKEERTINHFHLFRTQSLVVPN